MIRKWDKIIQFNITSERDIRKVSTEMIRKSWKLKIVDGGWFIHQ